MSKRARITLDLDPEPAEAEPVAAATPKVAPEVAATTKTGLGDKARKGPEAKAKAKAKPRSKPKAKAKAAAEPKPEQSPKPEMGAGARPPIGGAGEVQGRPKADAGPASAASVKPQERIASGFRNQPAKATRPSAPPPGMLNLGTVLKVAAVGLVVVAVAWWLKRKP